MGQRLCNSGSDSIFVRNLPGADRIFLTGNYDLTVPGDLAAYMTGECIGVLVPAIFVVWFIIRSRLFEEYAGFLSEDSGGKTGKICSF